MNQPFSRVGGPQRRSVGLLLSLALLPVVLLTACATHPTSPATRPIRTLLGGEYWGLEMTPDYVDYLAQVKPDLIHGGVLGPELASVMAEPGKLKAITPVTFAGTTNLRQYHDWWKAYLEKIHAQGIKVQATFSMVNLWGDHEQSTGWFKYYRDLWETDFLGPRPAADTLDLLERDARGGFIRDGAAPWFRYGGCVNNPAWRATLKAMVKKGVEAGFDGFMVQFPHARGACACAYCQPRFRDYLKARYSPDVLAQRYGIHDIDHYIFEATGPRPPMDRPIDIDARAFAALCVKDCFDDVFIAYGRSLKPDLIVSMWTHFRLFLHPTVMDMEELTNTDFAAWMDERALLPVERWGAGENYIWYSSPVYQTKLDKDLLGDNTLDYKYLRAMAGTQPFHVLKYEYFRWRATVGEALAGGGIAFGAWKGGWSGGQDREQPHLKSYFQFIRDHEADLFPRQSAAEATLIFPRQAAFQGDMAFLEPLRRLGAGLMSAHIPFDMTIDQKMHPGDLARYQMAIVPAEEYLSDQQKRMLDAFAAAGGCVATLPQAIAGKNPPAPAPHPRGWKTISADLKNRQALGAALRELGGTKLSSFDAPWRVQIHADAQPQARRLLIHWVNYNRDESQAGRENPLPAAPMAADVALPASWKVKRVLFLTPETPKPRELVFQQEQNRVRFATPEFLVYGLALIEQE